MASFPFSEKKISFTAKILLFVLVVWSLSPRTLAQAPGGVARCNSAAALDVGGLVCLEGIFDNVLTKVISLVGIFAFLTLIYGGLKYVTAGGDQKAMDGAKKTITYAVIGFLGAVAIYFIFQVVLQELGLLNFLQFTVPERDKF